MSGEKGREGMGMGKGFGGWFESKRKGKGGARVLLGVRALLEVRWRKQVVY